MRPWRTPRQYKGQQHTSLMCRRHRATITRRHRLSSLMSNATTQGIVPNSRLIITPSPLLQYRKDVPVAATFLHPQHQHPGNLLLSFKAHHRMACNISDLFLSLSRRPTFLLMLLLLLVPSAGHTTTTSTLPLATCTLKLKIATSAQPATKPSADLAACVFTVTPTPARSLSSAHKRAVARPSVYAAT